MRVNTAPHPSNLVMTEADDRVPRLALRATDAAKSLGISKRLLWTLTNDGKIPHLRLNRLVIYPVDELRTWLRENASGGR